MSDGGDFLFEEVFGDPAVAAHLSDHATVQAMLDVEGVLAQVEGDLGLIPSSAVEPITAAADADGFNLAQLAQGGVTHGNLAIPLVEMLRRAVAERDPTAADWVHFGATSQDIVDTGLVLQLHAAMSVIATRLDGIVDKALALSTQHVDSVMPGRTLMQHATPTTFGLVAATWADAVRRVTALLRERAEAARVLQFGGASGTLAALGARGLQVAEGMALRLGLQVPAVPWHADRDRFTALACAMGVTCGALGKVARDIALVSQTDVGELSIGAAGGSSTMPHKRNPVGCAVVLAAATRAPGLVASLLSGMPQELQRGLGGWHAEWEPLRELTRVTGGAARALDATLAHLEVHADRMHDNLTRDGGISMAEAVTLSLTPMIGRVQAHGVVADACARARAESQPLAEVLAEVPEVAAVLSREQLRQLTAPSGYLGVARELIARVAAPRHSDPER